MLGKFTFVPTAEGPADPTTGPGPTHLTDDWRTRQSAGALEFELRWIPFLDDRQTPLDNLTHPWAHDHEVVVGTVTFPKTDFNTAEARLTALLASELGASPGNWQETSEGPERPLPATRFTAARHLAYRASQKTRHALADENYASFFERGEILRELADELIRRYREKRAAGHWVPDVGEVSPG